MSFSYFCDTLIDHFFSQYSYSSSQPYHTSTRHPLFLLKLYFTMKQLLSIYHCPHFLSILHIDADVSLHENRLDHSVSLLLLISTSLAL